MRGYVNEAERKKRVGKLSVTAEVTCRISSEKQQE